MNNFKTIIERYCVNAGHNVAIEVYHNADGERKEYCLHRHGCASECEYCGADDMQGQE